MSKPESTNVPSSLLAQHENDTIFNLLGRKCTTLSTAVVQVLHALPESRSSWTKRYTGVACFVKDNAKRSYFIRVCDLTSKSTVWEQELYNQFKYNDIRPYFHTFAADKFNAALNFASEKEARHFKSEIDKKLRSKQQRRQERKQQSRPPPAPALGGNVETSNRMPLQSTENTSMGVKQSSSQSLSESSGKKNKKDRSSGNNKKVEKKKRLTKDDIGKPENFQHVGHIGWDPQSGFDIDNVQMDDNWNKLMSLIGVSEKQMGEKETMEFIYDFVEKRGGIENVTREIEQEKSIPAAPPQPPARMGGPPPPPSRAAPSRGAPPPPPSRGAPPPPPPARGNAPPPPPPARGGPPPPPPSRGHAPPPPPMGRGVPPPPPPPMIGGPPPPPPPAVRGGAPPPPPIGGSSGRGALLDQIHKGTSLRKVTDDDKRTSSGTSGRDDLLSDIRSGIKLKQVSEDDMKPAKPKGGGGGGGGILNALQAALELREKAIHSSDEDSESGSEFEDDEDEWMD